MAVPKSMALLMALVAPLAACWSEPPPEEDPFFGEPTPAELDIDEYFMLAVGAPSDLHVHLRQGYREIEPITILEARCSEHCSASVRPDGVTIRVVAHEKGDVTLDVTARRANGEIVSKVFQHEAALHGFDVVFDRQSSPGAADGVVAGDAVTWYSVLNDAGGGRRMPELQLANLDSASVEVTQGTALVRTTKVTGAPFERGEEPEAYVAAHAITFTTPGHVELKFSYGELARTVGIDVVDPATATAVTVRRLPDWDDYDRQYDVTTRSGILDGTAIEGRLLVNPVERLIVVLRDASGREAVGGRPEVKLDVGSVVTVMPYTNGHFRLVTRSIGVSTIYVRLGAASTRVLVEVR